MCFDDARRALCLLLLVGPACSIASGDGEFLLEETPPPADPALYTLVHLKVEDGGQAAYEARDIFIDGPRDGQLEPNWALDRQAPVAAGTRTFELVGYHHEGDNDRGQVIHDDVAALTLDPVTVESGRTYVLAALEEDGAPAPGRGGVGPGRHGRGASPGVEPAPPGRRGPPHHRRAVQLLALHREATARAGADPDDERLGDD